MLLTLAVLERCFPSAWHKPRHIYFKFTLTRLLSLGVPSESGQQVPLVVGEILGAVLCAVLPQTGSETHCNREVQPLIHHLEAWQQVLPQPASREQGHSGAWSGRWGATG